MGYQFPGPLRGRRHECSTWVNTTWLRENFKDDVDEDEMGGDDG